MVANVPKQRGRPRKIVPLFSDPESERIRVEKCVREGRDPYPKYEHEPCAAELSLRADVEPFIPFELVLALNDLDEDGYPYTSPKVEQLLAEAKAKQKEKASEGGYMRERGNIAAQVIREEANFIKQNRDAGHSRSAVIQWIIKRRNAEKKKCAGRSELYRQLKASGLWP